jgi:hypothetical protein
MCSQKASMRSWCLHHATLHSKIKKEKKIILNLWRREQWQSLEISYFNTYNQLISLSVWGNRSSSKISLKPSFRSLKCTGGWEHGLNNSECKGNVWIAHYLSALSMCSYKKWVLLSVIDFYAQWKFLQPWRNVKVHCLWK